jgi:hypothetical protein
MDRNIPWKPQVGFSPARRLTSSRRPRPRGRATLAAISPAAFDEAGGAARGSQAPSHPSLAHSSTAGSTAPHRTAQSTNDTTGNSMHSRLRTRQPPEPAPNTVRQGQPTFRDPHTQNFAPDTCVSRGGYGRGTTRHHFDASPRTHEHNRLIQPTTSVRHDFDFPAPTRAAFTCESTR